MFRQIRRQFFSAALFAAAFPCLQLTAAPVPVNGVFVYSSLCQGEEDAGGQKILLLREPDGNTALYWRTEGPVLAPLLAYGPDVTINNATGKISLHFVDHEFGDAGVYQLDGMLSDNSLMLDGKIEGHMALPRMRTFDQRLPECGHK